MPTSSSANSSPPIRKASPPGVEPLSHRDQRPVALLVAERVVEPLEPVQVEQADAQPAAAPQLAVQPLLEAAAVAEPGQRVGGGRAHRLERAQHRALVQVVGGERGEQQQGEERLGLPQDDEDQGERGHDHQHERGRADRPVEQREEGLVLGAGDDERDQKEVDGVERAGRERDDQRGHGALQPGGGRAGRRPGERVDGRVVGEPDQQLLADRLDQELHGEGDHRRRRPAVEDGRADDEQARERGGADRDPLDRQREGLRDRGREHQRCDPEQDAERRRLRDQLVGGRSGNRGSGRDDGRDHGKNPPESRGCLRLRLKQGTPFPRPGGLPGCYVFTVFLRFAGMSSLAASRRAASSRTSARKRAQSSRCSPETKAPGGVEGAGRKGAR